MTRRWMPAALALLLGAGPAAGRELWRRGDASLTWTGSVRELAVVTRATDAERFYDEITGSPLTCITAQRFADCPAFRVVGDRDVWSSLTRIRTRLELRATPHWSATLAYDHELRFGILDTLEDSLGQGFERQPFLDLQDDVNAFGFHENSEHRRWRHLLYRASVQYESRHFEAVIGRQRIAWGVGRLWNPIDRFNAIGPLALEADQSPGVDAALLRWVFSGFSYLEAAWAPGSNREQARYALRLHGAWRELDYSLVAGRFDQVGTLGFDLASNLRGAAVRFEVVYSDPRAEIWPVGDSAPRELDTFWQVVASIDYQLDVGSGLYLLLEHLYNGNALGFGSGRAGPLLGFFESTATPPPELPPAFVPFVPGPYVRPTSSERFGGSQVISFARHQTGLELGYEFSAAWRGDFLAIYDWNGGSAVFFPRLTFTPVGSTEITLGLQLAAGPRRSQYGSAENLVFLLAEWFY